MAQFYFVLIKQHISLSANFQLRCCSMTWSSSWLIVRWSHPKEPVEGLVPNLLLESDLDSSDPCILFSDVWPCSTSRYTAFRKNYI